MSDVQTEDALANSTVMRSMDTMRSSRAASAGSGSSVLLYAASSQCFLTGIFL